MANMKFQAILPKQLQVGDEIVIKGEIEDGASDLSIKFEAEGDPDLSDVVYQLRLSDYKVFHNSKTRGEWSTETTLKDNFNIFNPENTNKFCIKFNFYKDFQILLYHGYIDGKNNTSFMPIDEFNSTQPIDAIHNVQIWDGMKNIEKISFRYNNGTQ